MEKPAKVLVMGSLGRTQQEFVEAMEDRGWALSLAHDLAMANALVGEAPHDVGISCFHDQDPTDTSALEKVIVNSEMEWIALIEEGELEDPALETEFAMVGTAPGMEKIFETVRRVAAVDAPVFISGESGTGKELAARAIHENSQRASAPFVAVNCAPLPDNLIQSELFGHEKGAFSGASKKIVGQIEAASGGTLFLDEIGDLPLELQVNLLRFLEERAIQRIGALDEIRVLSATHVDQQKAVREDRFREDLYHRLNVLQVEIPPLRERKDNIKILARFFFNKFESEKSMKDRDLSREALAVMQQYHWPGNIRELINRVRRAMVMCERRLIKPTELGLERRFANRHAITLEEARKSAEKAALISALSRHKVKKAADELGVSRVTLYRLMEKHGLERKGEHDMTVLPST